MDDTEVVGFEHRDASGFSTPSGTAGTASITGTNVYNTEELDGLGNNIGRLGDLIRPPHDGGPTRSPADSPTIDDMTMGDCTLDGIPVPCSMAFRSLRSGSALPAHLAQQYQHSPAFAFTPAGSGAFTVTLPKQVGWHVNPDGSIDRIYSQYSATNTTLYTAFLNTSTNLEPLWSIETLTKAAREVVEEAQKNPQGKCAKLLGKDALKKFNEAMKTMTFDGNVVIGQHPISNNPKYLGEEPSVSAVTNGGDIFLNPNGIAFKDLSKIFQNKAGKELVDSIQKAFDDVGASSQFQYAVAIVIHEFLHTTGKFKKDVKIDGNGNVNAKKSIENQREVIEKCFASQNEEH